MGPFFRRLGRDGRSRDRRRQGRLRPTLDRLETREMPVVFGLAVTANPRILPPSRQAVTVRVRGTIASNIAEVPSASYQVVDQYRRVNRVGPIELEQFYVNPKRDVFAYKFSTTITLPAQVNSGTKPGRTYYILVSAGDSENSQGEYAAVIVPTVPLRLPKARRPAAQR